MALTDNCVAFYKCEDESDATGNGRTLTNTNTATFVAGFVNNGVNLVKASSQRLKRTDDGGIAGGAMSISLWYKPAADPVDGTTHGLAAQADGGTFIGQGLSYHKSGGVIRVRARRLKQPTAEDVADYTVTLPTASYTHLVYTYSGTTIKLFVNGVYRATVASSGNGSSGLSDILVIGALPEDSNFANGVIDAVGFWSRALTDGSPALNGTAGGEIAQLYNAGVSGAVVEYPFSAPAAASSDSNFFGGGI